MNKYNKYNKLWQYIKDNKAGGCLRSFLFAL